MELAELAETDVLSLGMQADAARRARSSGGIVTFLRVHRLTAAELDGSGAVPEAAAEIRLYETPSSLEQALAQLQALRRLAGERRTVAYSLSEIEQRARDGWGSMASVVQQLVASGLTDFAEIPVDRLQNLNESLGALAEAGLRPARLTVSHPPGDRNVELLETVCESLEHQASAIRFAPLARVAPPDKPTTGYEDVRTIALSRLALSDVEAYGHVSIEVDWQLYGPKLAQVALTFGADHLDSVLATSNPALGPRRGTIEEVERNIRAAGFEPREYRP